MAEHDPKKVTAILKDYEEALETLTFNSKPLINDLTMAADRYTPLAPQIVGKIESRLFEVFTSSLYFFLACMPYRVLCPYFINFERNADCVKCHPYIHAHILMSQHFSQLCYFMLSFVYHFAHVLTKMSFGKKGIGSCRIVASGLPACLICFGST